MKQDQEKYEGELLMLCSYQFVNFACLIVNATYQSYPNLFIKMFGHYVLALPLVPLNPFPLWEHLGAEDLGKKAQQSWLSIVQ